MRHLPHLAFSLALSLPTIGHAQSTQGFASPDLAHFSYGILCYHSPGTPGQFLPPAALDALGPSERVPVAFETLVVPAIPEIRFGVVVGLHEGKSFTAQSTITLTPNAAEVVQDVADLSFYDMPQDDGWEISELTEFTLGTYRFRTVYNDATLYDVTFTVVPAESYPGPLPACVPAP